MATEFTGTGDPARSMALLWRDSEPAPRGRGAAAGLSVDRIVATAIALADAEGLDALSMRRVATELAIGAMSLYTYIPGKGELIDLMLDAILGELPPGSGDPSWRVRVRAIARDIWALYERHPWALQVSASGRPPLGPNVMAKYERELRALDGIGLTDLQMDDVVTLLNGFVTGTARGVLEQAQARQETGTTEQQWWTAIEPFVAQVFDARRYPTVARVGPAAGEAQQAAYDPHRAFEFGLARLLDGIAALLPAR